MNVKWLLNTLNQNKVPRLIESENLFVLHGGYVSLVITYMPQAIAYTSLPLCPLHSVEPK